MPEGVDTNAINEALQSHVDKMGAQQPPMPPENAPEPPAGGKPSVKSGPGFDSHTKVLARALIQKLLEIV